MIKSIVIVGGLLLSNDFSHISMVWNSAGKRASLSDVNERIFIYEAELSCSACKYELINYFKDSNIRFGIIKKVRTKNKMLFRLDAEAHIAKVGSKYPIYYTKKEWFGETISPYVFIKNNKKDYTFLPYDSLFNNLGGLRINFIAKILGNERNIL